jgi:transcriptional regulator with XRE-family HTH domain
VTTVKKVKPISPHEIARRAAGLSLADLASSIGCDPSYASRIEAGEIPASQRYRRGFARACQVAVNEVFDHESARVMGNGLK